MSAKLVVIAGPDAGRVFPIASDSVVTIGRGEAAHVRLADPAVSRVHCMVEYRGGIAILKDNCSRTGTRVNDKAITVYPLQPGEVICVGATKMQFQWRCWPAPARE